MVTFLIITGVAIVVTLVGLRLIRGSIDSKTDYLKPPNPMSKRVERGLPEGEVLLWETREHPISLFAILKNWKVAVAIAVLVGGSFVADTKVVLLAWLIAALVLGIRIFMWDRTRICLTDSRLLVISGILTVKHKTMPLGKMTDQTTEFSALSNTLAWLRIIKIQYATLVVESAGQDQALSRILYVPHGPQVNRLIMGRVLKKL